MAKTQLEFDLALELICGMKFDSYLSNIKLLVEKEVEPVFTH